jgi:hypothetical protein
MKLYIDAEHHELLKREMAAGRSAGVVGTVAPDGSVATATGLAGGVDNRPVIAASEAGIAPLLLRFVSGEVAIETREGGPVETVTYAPSSFFRRTPFSDDVMDHLRGESVLIVGLGSVGAPVARDLAAAGVGTLVGLDRDCLEIHNCMRHVLGRAYVGWPKPIALAEHLRELVPSCRFLPVFGDLFKRENRRYLKELVERARPTRLLAVTDVLDVQYWCQRLAFEFDLPFMAVWCDNNAVEGELFLWEPGQASGWSPGRPERGCYACLRPMDRPTITRSRHFDYSSDAPDSYGGEPALGAFINRINDIATIHLLAWMLRDCPSPTKLGGLLDKHYEGLGLQYVRLGGAYSMEESETLTAKSPWAVEWYRVRRLEQCPICSSRERNAAELFPDSMNAGVRPALGPRRQLAPHVVRSPQP